MDKQVCEYLDKYYSLAIGIEPDEKDYKRTYDTAKYLLDNKFTIQEIIMIFTEIGKNKITVNDLPDRLWNGLIEKGVFYYSNLLHITSKPPTWNPLTFKEECEPFFMEMVMNYNYDDLLNQYYSECRVPIAFRDKTKDIGALKHLINKYKNLSAPSLDFVLLMIKLAGQDTDVDFFNNVFDIERYAKEAFITLNNLVQNATLYKNNQIIWRDSSAM